jgi:hypothetical protein
MSEASIKHDAPHILDEWNKLSEQEKSQLLPRLLYGIRAWHAWSLSDRTRLEWLETQFRKAGIPFHENSLAR